MKAAGSYIVKGTDGDPEITVLATGSEVSLACEAAELAAPKKVRVVSVPSKELLDAQTNPFKAQLVGCSDSRVMVVEAGVKQSWESWVFFPPDDIFSIERFGESGPAKKVAEHLGFTAQALAARIKE